MKTNRVRGFTLLELLIAVAVFAVVSALAYGGLQAVLSADGQTRLRAACWPSCR
jgi:general secretion pathway protein J